MNCSSYKSYSLKEIDEMLCHIECGHTETRKCFYILRDIIIRLEKLENKGEKNERF